MPRYVVRHGVMRNLGVFGTRQGETYGRSMQVIARTNRGLEAGEVLCEATEHVLAQMADPRNGQILREQNDDDVRELRRLFEQQQREHAACLARIAELSLAMQLVDVERLYGGERVIVYYLAEERVDFRELVKVLAREFQTRIEMKQIGVRDEAKLLADYGDCGKPVCCNTHLSEMPPVSMRMAKLQKATLDPSKISGRCGRLKCCLRYEFDTYQELQKDLPPVGSEIITNKGRARVLAQEILAGQVLVEMEDMRRLAIDAADVMTVLKRSGSRSKSARRPGDDSGTADAAPRERSRSPRSAEEDGSDGGDGPGDPLPDEPASPEDAG
ncbi:MAG TPA: regulatory iron-sulfur-containing complex subunit RicT [Lacipirellulaceae bacterium]|nr:regulatory iron-sulfur-containing complex subunit RicT [Lacipirellulaceae bacterium]